MSVARRLCFLRGEAPHRGNCQLATAFEPQSTDSQDPVAAQPQSPLSLFVSPGLPELCEIRDSPCQGRSPGVCCGFKHQQQPRGMGTRCPALCLSFPTCKAWKGWGWRVGCWLGTKAAGLGSCRVAALQTPHHCLWVGIAPLPPALEHRIRPQIQFRSAATACPSHMGKCNSLP